LPAGRQARELSWDATRALFQTGRSKQRGVKKKNCAYADIGDTITAGKRLRFLSASAATSPRRRSSPSLPHHSSSRCFSLKYGLSLSASCIALAAAKARLKPLANTRLSAYISYACINARITKRCGILRLRSNMVGRRVIAHKSCATHCYRWRGALKARICLALWRMSMLHWAKHPLYERSSNNGARRNGWQKHGASACLAVNMVAASKHAGIINAAWRAWLSSAAYH